MRHATVTLTLREEDARWLLARMTLALSSKAEPNRIVDELKHALAECECGEATR